MPQRQVAAALPASDLSDNEGVVYSENARSNFSSLNSAPLFSSAGAALSGAATTTQDHQRGSLFRSEDDYTLYEQFNKGEKKNPLGPLYKVKPLDEEAQPAGA